MPNPARRTLRAIVPVAVAGVIASAFVATPAHAADHLAVPFTKPAWATKAADRGVVAADATVPFELVLDLQDQAGAEAYATAVSTPGSPQYRQFLSPADWIARFAPTQATYDDAVAQLTAAGLTVTGGPASREYIVGSGAAGAVGSFFSTGLHRFRTEGADRVAATAAPVLPAALARRTAAVSFDRAPVRSMIAQPLKTMTSMRCSAYWRQHVARFPRTYRQTSASTPLCGYSAKQLRSAYRLGTGAMRGVTGAGQTVAVVDVFGAASMRTDLATYSSRNHLPAADYREAVPARTAWAETDDCDAAGWQVEQSLDLEAAHAVAPRAALQYVGAADCGYGIDLALSQVLDQGLASIVSNSYGSPDEPDAPDAQIHQQLQAAGEGIGLYYASGDYGDNSEINDDGGASVFFPASSPWVTAVGGTAVALDRRGRRVLTSAWGDTVDVGRVHGKKVDWMFDLPGQFAGGAGGGTSALFPRPAYQASVPSSLGHGMRTAADVSALASDLTGFQVGYRPTGLARYVTRATGGTSLATPIVAAQVALAQQRAGHALGFLNPAAYALATSTPSAFRDVRPSSQHPLVAVRLKDEVAVVSMDRDSSLKARRGYDLPTGLGELTPAAIADLARG